MSEPLPIDRHLDAIRDALGAGHAVIEAPPGAGKTTRVPPALLDVVPGEIWVTEPRRLAARLAAARVAAELGEPLGRTAGYQVRFERAAGRDTRIRFVTEGVLLRRLASDPELAGVGAILFDEFHERSLDVDLGLALAVELAGARPDLRIGVMSATLDAGPLLRALPGCRHIRSEGRRFEVAIEYEGERDERPLEVRVRAAVRRILASRLEGHVLVFLPGAREIRRAAQALEELAAGRFTVLPLHGDLPAAEQDRAVAPAAGRKVILSTNVAESSVTIAGVVAVVDSGLARIASHSPWTGLPELRVARVSRASADQRAGRAGRTGPGVCVRLYGRHDFEARPARETPEVSRADLSGATLLCAALGRAPGEMPWLEPPPEAALAAARELLVALGAIEAGAGASGERVTGAGRRMLELPLHPRLARLVCAGDELGVGADALVAAALLGERHAGSRGRGEAMVAGDSDVTDLVERWRSRSGLDPRARRVASQALERLGRGRRQEPALDHDDDERDARLRRALLRAFPDRVARRREGAGAELVLAGGGEATVDPASVVRSAGWVVVAGAERRGGRVIARVVSAIDPDWLLDELADRVSDATEVAFDPAAERVWVVSRLTFGRLVLDESRRPPRSAEEQAAAGRALADAARRAPGGIAAFADADALARLSARLELASGAFPERDLPSLAEPDAAAALEELCAGRQSFAELREADLASRLRARLGESARFLDRVAPERIELAGGRRLRVSYEPDRTPWVSSRLQDFFGMVKTPAVAEGRVPLALHLLAPSGRAVQITTDLAGFWKNHYPRIKRELERRYPRHAWPADPTTAAPARPRRRRS